MDNFILLNSMAQKRHIRQNLWGNWCGYFGTGKVLEFGTDKHAAEFWVNGGELPKPGKLSLVIQPPPPPRIELVQAIVHALNNRQHAQSLNDCITDALTEFERVTSQTITFKLSSNEQP